jgi:hypothetical protein
MEPGLVLLVVAINLVLLYGVVKTAVVHALRRARHEERVELLEPEKIPWFGERERDVVRRIRP